METKICYKCKLPKDVSEFNIKGKSLQPWCKTCQHENAQIHYQNNKQYYFDKNKRLKQVNMDYVRNIKENSKCDCGENHPATLQFHHRDPTTKLFNIAEVATRAYSLKTVKKEIEKCNILCANCHAKKHYIRP